MINETSSSILSEFPTSIFTAYCETRFVKACVNVSPIATFVPEATTTFLSTGSESVSFTYC